MGLFDKGRGHSELAFSQQVHSDGAVYQREVALGDFVVCG